MDCGVLGLEVEGAVVVGAAYQFNVDDAGGAEDGLADVLPELNGLEILLVVALVVVVLVVRHVDVAFGDEVLDAVVAVTDEAGLVLCKSVGKANSGQGQK